MAVWPELDELKQVLDITEDHWDGDDEYGDHTRLTRLLEAAIARVKQDVGVWDEDEDEPTPRLAQAALRMAELMALKPMDATGLDRGTAFRISQDPTYRALLMGHRKKFGVA